MLESLLSRLAGAKQNKVAWAHVAGLVRGLYAEAHSGIATKDGHLRLAAKSSGYTPGALRRMVSALEYGQRLERERRVGSLERLLDLPYYAVEALKRLDDLDRQAVDTLIPQLLAGDITYPEVIRRYNEAANLRPQALNGQKAGRRSALAFLDLSRQAAERHMAELSDSDDVNFWVSSRRLRLIRPMVMLVDNSFSFIDAIDAKFFSAANASGIDAAICEAALAATFFRRYWLFVPAEAGVAAQIAEMLDTLSLRSTGVVAIGGSAVDPLDIHKRPSGPPVPDRQADLKRRWARQDFVTSLQTARRTSPGKRPHLAQSPA